MLQYDRNASILKIFWPMRPKLRESQNLSVRSAGCFLLQALQITASAMLHDKT